MAFEAYDADGNLIEGIVPPEEVKTLQEKLNENEQKLNETNEKLSKLENKDFNFRKLEAMTEEEKSKLTAAEIALKEQQEKLEDEQKKMQSSFVGDIKNDLLDSIAGSDVELRKKIELKYSLIKDSDNVKSRAEIKALMEDAYAMAVGVKTRSPLNSAMNSSGDKPSSGTKPSDEVIALGKKMGLSDEDLQNIK
jgi:hypothetical protein